MASEKQINEARGDECWIMKAVLYSENGTRQEGLGKKLVFIKSRAANINMTFDISALKRRRWAASHAPLSGHSAIAAPAKTQQVPPPPAGCSEPRWRPPLFQMRNNEFREAWKLIFIYFFQSMEGWWRMFSSKNKQAGM